MRRHYTRGTEFPAYKPCSGRGPSRALSDASFDTMTRLPNPGDGLMKLPSGATSYLLRQLGPRQCLAGSDEHYRYFAHHKTKASLELRFALSLLLRALKV